MAQRKASEVNAGGPQRLQTIDRALELLERICQAEDGVPLTTLSRQTGLPKSTVHRLLMTLSAHRLVTQDPETGRYLPGIKLFELAQAVLQKLELRKQALPELRELCQRTNETVHLAILDDGDVIYIDKQESQQTIRMFSAIGKRGPAHCTGVGKVLLAALPEHELDELIRRKGLPRFTEKTITDPELLKAHLAEVRRKGYAVDDTEHEPEIRCVACPIREHTGRVIAAVSLTIPAFRATREQIEALAPLVRTYADRISRKMGWTGEAM